VKVFTYLLFTTTIVTGTTKPTVDTDTTHIPDKAGCVQAVADFINEGAYKNYGTYGSSEIKLGDGLVMKKTAKCSKIGQGED
jgi:hypothetical protein